MLHVCVPSTGSGGCLRAHPSLLHHYQKRLLADVAGPVHPGVHWEISAELSHLLLPLELLSCFIFVLTCRTGIVSIFSTLFLGLVQLASAYYILVKIKRWHKLSPFVFESL